MRKTFLAYFLIFSFFLSGCFVLRITIRNLSESISSSPEKIKNLIRNPVRDSVKLSSLWVGHTTTLLQIYDKVIILDPFLNNRINGIFIRKREPALDINDLTKLDLILISHSHMDHLSYVSVDMLENKFPGCALVFPDGVEDYMPNFNLNLIKADTKKSQGTEKIGDAIDINGIKITPVFALHQGGRYAIDTYSWMVKGATGYIIQYKDVCVYFAGDTGYDDKAFKKIGEAFKIDLAIIPIGPCRNCEDKGMWFHTSTIEALKLFEDIKATYMIPIHYGAIEYFTDADYPVRILKKILQNPGSGYNYLSGRVKILKEGEQLVWNEYEKENTLKGSREQ